MLTLLNFCDENKLQLKTITYKNVKKKGFDIVKENNEIVCSFEPFQNGWKVAIKSIGKVYFIDRITKSFLSESLSSEILSKKSFYILC